MSAFDAINLDKLPAPKLVEELDAEMILTEMKADLITRAPELAGVMALESSVAVKILEGCAYRELLLRARVNDAGRAVMLAFATGSDLDHIGARYNVQRAVVQQADPAATPPVPEVLEEDTRLRHRIQLALEGLSTAGPTGAYTFHGLSADPDVKDIGIASFVPGQVDVTVLSRLGDGTPSVELIAAVTDALNDEDVRPLTDLIDVQPATITAYTVDAILTLFDGPDSALVVAAAQTAVQTYVEDHHRLGHDITISGLHAALHQAGVQNVALTLPAADLVIAPDTAAYCTGIAIAFGGRDV